MLSQPGYHHLSLNHTSTDAFGSFPTALSTQSSDLAAYIGEFQNHSSVGFYLARPVLLVDGRTTVLEFGSHYPDCPPVFLAREESAQKWKEPVRMLLLVTDDDQFAKVKDVLAMNSIC